MTNTLAPEARRNVALFSATFAGPPKPRMFFKKNPDGTQELVVQGQPVFRSGTFRDSMGFQHVWEDSHMSQMVDNFDLLKQRAIFADVPVRKGHPSFFGGNPMDELIGYTDAIRTEKFVNPADHVEYTYVLADYRVLDSTAAEKINSGLWRNISSEVGSYVTNSEAEFWPAFMGFAYVDIPAVEGLHVNGFSKAPGVGTKFSIMSENEKEAPLVGAEGQQSGEQTPPQGTSSSAPAPATSQAPADAPPAQNQSSTDVGAGGAAGEQTPPNAAAATAPQNDEEKDGEGKPTQDPPATAPQTSNNAKQGSTNSFRCDGAVTSDFAAVQRHIDGLEQFRKETIETGRKNFVKGLAEGDSPKILATQIEQLEKFALSLDAGQYETWRASWDAAPGQSLFASHGSNASNPEGNGADDESLDELETLRGIVAHHRASGMKQPQIEELPSWKRLQQLESKS